MTDFKMELLDLLKQIDTLFNSITEKVELNEAEMQLLSNTNFLRKKTETIYLLNEIKETVQYNLINY